MEKEDSFEERLEEANLLLRYKEYEEACKIYRELLKESPTSAELHNNYGLALFYLDRFNEALDEFKKAIEIDNSFALPYSNIGLIYLNKKDYNRAEEFFLKALKIDPENPETHYNIAVTYYRMGKKQEALKHYESFLSFCGQEYGSLKESVKKIIFQIKESLQTSEGSQV